jgi:hypothetical protein
MTDTVVAELADWAVPVGLGVRGRVLAWERAPGYTPGGSGMALGVDLAGTAAALRSMDDGLVGAALAMLPADRLAAVVGAAVSPLANEDAACVLGEAIMGLEAGAAAAVARSLRGPGGAGDLRDDASGRGGDARGPGGDGGGLGGDARGLGGDGGYLLGVIEDALSGLGDRALGGAVGDEELHASWGRLHRLERRVVAEKYRHLCEIDARGSYLSVGARTLVDLLIRYGLTRGEAREQVETAVALAELPKTAEALAQGRIGAGQAAEAGKALADAKTTPDADGAPKDPETLDDERCKIDETAGNAPSDVDRRKLRERLEAQAAKRSKDRLADKEKRAHRKRYARRYRDGDGATIQIHGPAAAIAHIWTVVEAMSGRTSAEDDRSTQQRQFDAVKQIADRYLAEGTLPEVMGQRASVLLITSHDALHDIDGAQPPVIDGFGPVSSETARMICCDAEITTVVMGADGQPLRVGRSRYQPSRAQRRAVIARDRVCIGCGTHALRCEIHHVQWWERGGPTDIDNLVLACWNCHTHIHHHGWTVSRDPDGRNHAGPPPAQTPAARRPPPMGERDQHEHADPSLWDTAALSDTHAPERQPT